MGSSYPYHILKGLIISTFSDVDIFHPDFLMLMHYWTANVFGLAVAMEIVLPFVTSQKADLQSYVCFSIFFLKSSKLKK